MHGSTDERLVGRLKSGDAGAFGELYALYRTRVYRFAFKLSRDADQAEDIVQEAFLKAQRSIGGLQESGSLASWLFAITRNEVYTFLRRTRSNGTGSVDDVWEEETPFDEFAGAETVEIVQRMIATLKPEYREAILLREYEKLSYAEIAHATGDSVAAIKARLFKARKALAEKLKPFFGEGS